MPNLVLGVKAGEAILIGNDIRIEVVEGGNGKFLRLKITAPREVEILRESLVLKEEG